jgi:hypothetical protein
MLSTDRTFEDAHRLAEGDVSGELVSFLGEEFVGEGDLAPDSGNE